MKVTHIIDSGGYYGAEVMLVHLCQAQQKAGLQVEVISIGTRGNYIKPLEEKLKEYGIDCLPWRMLALPDLRESFKILKYCRNNGTDIIHSHGYKGNILLGLIPKHWRKIPVVTTVHGYTSQHGLSKMAVNQWLDRFCLPRLDAVVIVSEGMRNQVNQEQIGDRLYTIANGIPGDTTSSEGPPVKIFSEQHFNIVSIGRLSPEKNFQFLISNMPRILTLIKNARLFIYGDGNERFFLEKLIKSMKLEDYVFLKGYTKNTSEIYKNASLFINCSTTEGMPITLLEAMREGCPLLASNIQANSYLLEPAKAQRLLFELDDKNFLERISSLNLKKNENLRGYFLENFTSEKMEKKYQKLYKKLTETKASQEMNFEKNLSAAWITWEIQTRNRSMANRLNIPLYELISKQPRLIRYVALSIKTISIAWKKEILFVQNPSIVLALVATLIKIFSKKIVIIDAHNSGIFPLDGKNKILNKITEFICRRSDKIIVTNENLAKKVNEWKGSPIVMPDPIPEIGIARKTNGYDKDKYILFICSWSSDEPYAEVFKASKLIDERIKIYITGNHQKSGINPRELPSNIKLLGFVDEEKYFSLLSGSMISMDLTTREDCLVCGAYETAALGVPGIISDSPINREIFSKGYIYTQSDATSIASAIEKAINDMDKLKSEIKLFKTLHEEKNEKNINNIKSLLKGKKK